MLREPWRTRLLFVSVAGNLFAAALIGAHYTMRPARPPGPPRAAIIMDRMALDLAPDDAARFRAAADSAASAWPAQDWWRNFRSPELDGLIARARSYNNDLAAAAARVIQADAQARISGAPLLPSLEGTSNFDYRRSRLNSNRSS